MSDFDVLENKIVQLLNKLKENHLFINKLKFEKKDLEKKIIEFQKEISKLKFENDSLRTTNSLLGSNESKVNAKRKINGFIKEIDFCINQLSIIK